MYIKTAGLVLRETTYKESSRILTVLTSTDGKLTVSARGAKRRGSKTAASAQLLAYSDMTIFADRGRYTLTETRSIELFEGLREDVELLSLGTYFAELLETLSDEDLPNPEMLSLGLNALYALSEGKRDPELVKAAFELRLMCVAGFEPLLGACPVCGKEVIESPVLNLTGGVVHCAACRTPGEGRLVHLNSGTLDAMRHIVSVDPKKLYSFSVGDSTKKQLSKACEAYLLSQLGTSFGTLDFYHRFGKYTLE
jgi:DNA repair protein RecO (recombination protein O)